ncbi:diguanylate cyclase domain-containing protein [Candidatus Magnetominusculus xianensis]|uniref:Diguanylate cyclase with PAS/PAC sensor n=1 Tax=Candidatus Magnetominusculus xianensis TaxID=1748249 RepID=A0ABR5SJV3_9BACT|nr:diguanylate cyclase [Candidatus Magnetominusculus xianensis]KWT95127.1 diguanylate cyclase with PAS/PAC sensor [Candidatus Magnetominusculus xianensis]MBF0402774.1 diguanylate cyclase [Nitrospirota bacterium]
MDERVASILEQLSKGRIPVVPPDVDYAVQLARLTSYLDAIRHFTLALSSGDLSQTMGQAGMGPVVGSLKALHSSLKHLTWQTKQIALGDFSQRVEFMGEFAEAFNTMVVTLGESRAELEQAYERLNEDMMELQLMSAELQQSEERFRLIAESVSDVIWTLDASLDSFTYVSPSIASLRGFTVDEAINEKFAQALTPKSYAYVQDILMQKLSFYSETGTLDSFSERIEIEQVCKDGRIIPVEVVISAIISTDGNIKEFVGISRDITERKREEEKLKYESTHDSMTGLYNRAYFDDELGRIANGPLFPVSFIVADLDGLKRVNDSIGHEAGDQLIRGASDVLKMAFRGSDVVARTGGDEFLIILNMTDEELAAKSIGRIRIYQEQYNKNSGNMPVSISLGTATAYSAGDIPSALKEADKRMYDDKVSRKQQRVG